GQRQARRNRQHVPRIHHHFLGHAAAGQQGADAIPHLPRTAGAHFGDHPGTFQAEDVAGAGRRRVMSRPLQQVRTVQTGRRHTDTHLTGSAGFAVSTGPFDPSFDTLQCLHAASIVIPTWPVHAGRSRHHRFQATGTDRRPTMRSHSSLRRPTLPRLFGGLALAFALALSLPLQAKTTQLDWSSLKPDRNQVIASLNVVELLRRHHYNQPPLDDARSAKIYDSYLKMLDPSRSYFMASDIAEFEPWRLKFDDFLKEGQLEPGFTIYTRHLQRLIERVEYALGLVQDIDKLDFTLDEELELDRETASWPRDRAELDDLWRKRVKDEVLRLKIAGKEPEAIRELLTKRYQNQLTRLRQTRSEDIFQAYINAFAQTYDPHTSYLSPDSAENFDINMSLSLEGIGAVLQSDNEMVKIVRLVPAGPAEKSKQLVPADRIVGVAQGDGEMIDVIGWRLDEVVKLIRGPKGSKVRLEIIPASNAPNDQTSRVVTLTREAVKLEEQAA